MRVSSCTLRALTKVGAAAFLAASAVLAVSTIHATAAAGDGAERSAALVRPAATFPDGDDGAAIPPDAGSATIDLVARIASPLVPLGTLASSRYALPSHRILTRRSPRGPPVFR